MAEFFRVLSVCFGFGCLATLFVLYRQKRQWAELAKAASLDFNPQGPRIVGSYRGRPILVDITMRRGYKRWIYYMRVRLPTRGLEKFNLNIHKKSGTVGRQARRLQPTMFMILNEELAKEYRIELKPDHFQTALVGKDSPIRRLVEQIEVQVLKVAGDELYCEILGVNQEKDKFVTFINTLVDSAEFCERMNEEPHPKPFTQRKDLPSETEFLEDKRITKRQNFGVLALVILFGLLSLLPYFYLALP